MDELTWGQPMWVAWTLLYLQGCPLPAGPSSGLLEANCVIHSPGGRKEVARLSSALGIDLFIARVRQRA